MSTSRALVVLSGGQDSTTCLYWAKQHFAEIHAITFDYNQRHRREIEAARTVAAMAGVTTHEVVELGPILAGRSPLTDPGAKLETYPDFATMDKVIGGRVELTFVPMRNPLFLTIAANRAACGNVFDLVTGVCQADNANYPDCREGFLAAMETAVNRALGRNNFQIHAPLLHKPKAEAIAFALEMPGCYPALGYSHTAYDGAYPPLGGDHASVLRAHGFEEAGVPDPLIVRAWLEGVLPDLPHSGNYGGLITAGLRHWGIQDALVRLEERLVHRNNRAHG